MGEECCKRDAMFQTKVILDRILTCLGHFGHSEVLVTRAKLRTRLGCLSSGGRHFDPRQDVYRR